MSFATHTTMSIEVELDLEGVFQPGRPASGPSYNSGGEPEEPDCIEDAEVTGLYIERVKRGRYGVREYETVTLPGGQSIRRPVFERIDLLALLSPEARAEVLNVLGDVLDDEIEAELLANAYAEAA